MKLVKSIVNKEFDEKKFWLLFIFIITTIFVVFSFVYSGKQSFWYDEFYTVGFVSKKNTIFDTLWYYLTWDVHNVPLYAFVFYWWYRICPLNEQYMLLISQVATLVGIIYCIRLGKKLGGYIYASIVAILLLTSNIILCNVAWELRAYSFLFMFSAMMIYYYYEYKDTSNVNTSVKLGIVMTLLLYSHYFGGIEIALLGVTDFLIFIRTKNKEYKWMISYIIPAVIFTPWFIAAMIYKTRPITEFWPAVPSLKDIINPIKYLLDDNLFFMCLLIFGIVYAFTIHVKKREELLNNGFIKMLSLHFIVSVIGVFIYSGMINTKGSVWVSRYFTGFLPYIVIVIAYGVYMVIKLFADTDETKNKLSYSVLLSAYVSLALFSYTNTMSVVESPKGSTEAYREVANKICEDKEEVVYVYSTVADYVNTGWEEVYFTKTVKFFGKDFYREIEELNPDSVYVITKNALGEISNEKLDYLSSNYTEVWRDDKLNLVYYRK